MSESVVESCELGLSVCSAAHAAEVGDCEVISAVCFSLLGQKVKGQGHRVIKCKKTYFSCRRSIGQREFALYRVPNV